MKRTAALMLSGILYVSSIGAHADVVVLANGDRLTGTVTTIQGGQMLVSTEHMGVITVPMDQVAGVDKTAPMKITTASGAEVTGVLSSQGGQQVIQTDSGVQSVAVTDLSQAVEDYLGAPELGDDWTTNLDFGYVVSKGNSDTQSGSAHLDSILKRGDKEHRVFAYWNRDEAEEEITRDVLDAGYDFRWYFRDQWYALANLGYFQDKLKDIDSRITVGAGVGYQFFNHSLASLSTELGISQVFEDLGGESDSNPAVRWAVDYTRWLSPERIDYFYGHEVLKILDSDRGEIYKANTGVRFHLSDLWTANARIDMVHETKPPEGSHKTDLIYSIGVGVVF